ncbi:autotransporter outer membrane beta-barrel domain-containing protein [Streptomyces lydicus]|uniref:hypothetical protein n=1 Tax=Streptomyces lydicus TaxID=47763 RepID=UPI00098251C6|nr:hypothetical protein [Streptomyces lydicus]
MSPIGPPQAQDGPSGFDPGLEDPPVKFGVWGDSSVGSGVVGSSGRPGTSGPSGTTPGGAGTLGINQESQGVGVLGRADASTGTAVLGTSGQGTGVAGRSKGANPGVAGVSKDGDGVTGTSTAGNGVSGTSTAGNGMSGISAAGGTGVVAGSQSGKGLKADSVTGTGIESDSFDGIGILGQCGHSDSGGFGFGFSPNNAPGVMGTSFNGSGVHGFSLRSEGMSAFGQVGIVAEGEPLAGDFRGDVHVSGALTQGGGGIHIDHPLDPENRFLDHTFVQSPEMKNVYDGTATLDDRGTATVQLPDWFDALNENVQYQLTAIGGPAPGLHISRPVEENRFAIAGGDPGQQVCWQVTGARRDAWARTHPVVADGKKEPEERGYYLHPEAHGQPAERAIGRLRHPETVTRESRVEEAERV